jgi:predicted nucleotidyltransferase
LKLIAWIDRHTLHNRDADDMAFILNNYLSINEERAATQHYEKLYLDEDFSPNKAGAKLLGIDMSQIIGDNTSTKDRIIETLKAEIEKEEQSKLVNQIIETNKSFAYVETIECLKNIIAGFNEN